MSKKLEQSLKKIDKLFKKMEYNDAYKKRGGASLSHGSYDGYRKQIRALLRLAHNQYGIDKIEDFSEEMYKQIIKDMIIAYEDGQTGQSKSINSRISAIRVFRFGMEQTNIYRTTKAKSIFFNEIDPEKTTKKIRDFVKASGVSRKASHSQILRANREQSLKVIENLRINGYDTENRRLTADAALISLITGARISSVLSLKARDIRVSENRVEFVNAKGGLTYSAKITKESAKILIEMKKGLKPGQKLFEFKRKNGTFLPFAEAAKLVHRYVSEAGGEFKSFKIVEEKKKDGTVKQIKIPLNFSTHALRKAYALDTMSQYVRNIKTQNDVKKELERLSKLDPNVQKKFDVLYKKSNTYRRKEKLPYKPVSVRAAIVFFTSCNLGHYRLDVVGQYYCSYAEAINYIKSRP